MNAVCVCVCVKVVLFLDAVTLSWLFGFLPILVVPVVVVFSWAVVSLRNRHEAILLARTFELAMAGKDQKFREYMWRHIDLRMLRQDF